MRSVTYRFNEILIVVTLFFGGLGAANPVFAGVAADTEQAAADREAEYQARRQKMIEACKANRGVDCETEVDTELEAEQMGGGRAVIVPQRPRPVVPRPRPRPAQ